mgnify:CR=1 FL=1
MTTRGFGEAYLKAGTNRRAVAFTQGSAVDVHLARHDLHPRESLAVEAVPHLGALIQCCQVERRVLVDSDGAVPTVPGSDDLQPVHALPGFQASPGAVASPACAGPVFTVATVNVQFSNEHRDAFRAWLATQPADFLVIQEVTEAWAAEIEAQTSYPYRHVLSREDPYGLALLSRWPMESVTLVDLAGDGLPSLAGIVDADGQRIRFLGLHTHWPLTPALAAARDEALRGAAQLASAADLPVVLLGDLNPEWKDDLLTILRAHGVRPHQEVSGVRRHAMACPALPTCGLGLAEAERYLPGLIRRIEVLAADLGLGDEEIIIRDEDGKDHWVSATAAPIRDAEPVRSLLAQYAPR